MVERFHHQLKSALQASQTSSWMEFLPLVLLGVRTALKEDIKCTAAELVYGVPLRLPGEFFTSVSSTDLAPSTYMSRLRQVMQHLRPPPPRQTSRDSFVSDHLSSCSHVFVHHDAVRKPLQAPYDGPYQVLERHPKYFLLDINGKQKTVSIDRLKPAHVETSMDTTPSPTANSSVDTTPPPAASSSVDTTPPPAASSSTAQHSEASPATHPRTTRSGQRVHWPKYLASYVP